MDTVFSLRKAGYTGKICLLVDDLDPQLDDYFELWDGKDGIQVCVFSKEEVAKVTDKMDNFGRTNVVVFARNAVYAHAERLGFTHIAVLDDDYILFEYRVNGLGEYAWPHVRNMDDVFSAYVQALRDTKVKCICFSQGGDFVGGESSVKSFGKRKGMNLFFLDVSRPLVFRGTINEDLTMSVDEAVAGEIVISPYLNSLVQRNTQTNGGGLTDVYLDLGTYVKSFYSVMAQPSAVVVSELGHGHRKRLHHRVSWKHCAPMIVRHDKEEAD